MRRTRIELGILATLGGLVGCPSPCADLNDVITAHYQACGVPLTAELEDGGHSLLGLNCGANEEEGLCVQQCWQESTCEDVAGSQNKVKDCAIACYEPCRGSRPFGSDPDCSPLGPMDTSTPL